MVNFFFNLAPFAALPLIYPIFTCVDPDPYLEYVCGFTEFLNTDPIWIQIRIQCTGCRIMLLLAACVAGTADGCADGWSATSPRCRRQSPYPSSHPPTYWTEHLHTRTGNSGRQSQTMECVIELQGPGFESRSGDPLVKGRNIKNSKKSRHLYFLGNIGRYRYVRYRYCSSAFLDTYRTGFGKKKFCK